MAEERKPARRVEASIEIDAPLDAVWKALTDGEELARWFPLAARVTPGPGGSIWMSWGSPWEGEAKIEIWEPERRLRLTEPPPRPDSIPVALEYTLETRGGKTVLLLVQTFGTGDDWEEEYFDSTSRGWQFMFANLRHYLERHAGTPRQVAWPRWRVAGDAETIWSRLLGPEGLAGSGSIEGVEPGSRFRLQAAGDGEHLEGTVKFFIPPRSLCARVENLNDALLWVHLEKSEAGYEIWLWLSAYGLAKAEV
ncbi:MAG: SRPBCC family protein, partial [Candidatus Acidiferrales bacterium]